MNDSELVHLIKKYKIKHFRGVHMRDSLPKKPWERECAIINLDSIKNVGTHWCSYFKMRTQIYYFDSFGNLPPPPELISYFGNDVNIFYNTNKYQDFNTSICGQLCIMFLHYFSRKMKK